jgi:hypothetical protein
MRQHQSLRRSQRAYRQASMTRQATMDRISSLEIKVAAMEYQAGMKDSLKGMFLKYIVNPLDKFRRHLDLFQMPLDDLMDDVVEAVVPSIADGLLEDEVSADFDEFVEGATLRQEERRAGQGKYFLKGKSDFFWKGYQWGDVNDGMVPDSMKKQVIEEAAIEHKRQVFERALKKAFNVINPVEIIKHAYHIIKKYGWDADADKQWYVKWPMRFFKVVLMAIAVAIVETIEHVVLPTIMIKLTGNQAWAGLAAVPLLEIILPLVTAYFKGAKKDVVDEASHLDWYEDNYGEIEDNIGDENVFTSRNASVKNVLQKWSASH